MTPYRWLPMAAALLCLQACATTPADSTSPSADGEVIPASEAAATAAVTAHIRASITEGFQREGHAFRDAHRKAHGCVSAQFTVLDKLTPALAHGVFAKPRSFDAVIRFSNGSQQDDRKGDARGMAIKLLGVDGPKLLNDESDVHTQDFLLMNHPVFFVRDAADYVGFQQATSGGTLQLLGWLTRHLFHESAILLNIKRKTVTNPLDSLYWSTTPSKLGPQAIKFSAQPCAGSRFTNPFTSPDLLRENMTAHLATGGACFDFMVQTQADPSSMPIEDPTIEWDANRSPFVPVARIQIPAQPPEQGEACEVRSFTPWHTLAEHRPLGGISRVRKTVYQEISRLRHQLNGQPRTEP
ncbi:MAG: catalase family protein [Pseudomonadota bacterium]